MTDQHPWRHEPRKRLTDHLCSAEECGQLARCMVEIGPLCGKHYQRFVKYGTTKLPIRVRPDVNCTICGRPIEATYARVRFKRRGHGFCSYACSAVAKTAKADEDASMRFMRRVVMLADEECWPFKGKKNKAGYPLFDWRAPGDLRGRPHMASRIMWLILNGPIPEDREVCHSCDNPGCCNPGHLWLGTHKENMEDMARKGRGHKNGVKGSDHPRAKLAERHVLEIRTADRPVRELARRYGVSSTQILNIKKRKSWAHV